MDIGQVRGNLFTIKRDFWNTCGLLTRVCKRDLTSLLGQQQYSISTTRAQVQSNNRPSTKYQETRLHGSIVGRCRGEYASTWPALSPSQRYLWPQWPPLGREPPPLHRCIISQCTIQTSVLCSDYVSLVLCSSPVLLSCSAPTCPLYAVLRPLCWCVPLLCPLLCSVLCVAVLSTTCFLCSVLLCSASTCLLSRPRPCADQVTLPELSNHLSHSAATCRELQLNLKSSNM